LAEQTARREGVWVAAICVAVAVSRWLTRATVPDDPDSFGFILGMSQRYDLEALQPHFPGYPVYVALGWALCRLGVSGLRAAAAISAIASGFSALGLFACTRRLAGSPAAFGAVALYAVAWMPWFLGGGAQSETLGLALTISAFAMLALPQPRPWVSGVLAGLVLGTRVSYWPLVASMAVTAPRAHLRRPAIARLVAGLLVGTGIWAIPFLAVTGPSELWRLGQVHLQGHFGWWGGSISTRPDLLDRARFFLRDWLFDGLAPSGWALAAVTAIAVGTVIGTRSQTPSSSGSIRRLGRVTALIGAVLAPYALWVFLAQNVLEQPRHLLPVVVGSLIVLGILLSRSSLALGAVVALAVAVNIPLVLERHQLPAAAGQAARWIGAHSTPAETAVMADRSFRFFEDLPGGITVRKHAWLSEVVVDLARFPHYPSAIWLTSEIDLHSGEGADAAIPPIWEITEGPRFCRDARIDRAQPCLSLRSLRFER
jgi:hypothetical protein